MQIAPQGDLPGIDASAGVTVDGSGSDVLINGSAMSTNGLVFRTGSGIPANDIVLRNLTLDQMPGNTVFVCPSPGGDLVLPCTYDVSNVLIENIVVNSARGSGMYIASPVMSNVSVSNVTIENTNGDFALLVRARNMTGVSVDGLTTSNSQYVGFDALGGPDSGIFDSSFTNGHLDESLLNMSASTLISGLELRSNEVSNTVNPYDTINVHATDTDSLTVKDNTVSNSGRVGINLYLPNMAGLTVSGNKVLDGNGIGMIVDNQFGSTGSNVVTDNQIKGNALIGLMVLRGGPVTISKNQISDNGGIGIDLGGTGVTQNDAGDGDSGPNTLLNFPEISGSDSQTLTGTACSNCTVELFQSDDDPSGYGEGEKFLKDADASANGDFTISICGLKLASGAKVTATATDSDGNTSEFSANFPLSEATGTCPTATPTPSKSPTPSPTPQGHLQGDVNCSGTITVLDGLQIFRKASGLPNSPACMDESGDTDCDGDITTDDGLLVVRKVAGLPRESASSCKDIGQPLT
jgi:hypothetical protein